MVDAPAVLQTFLEAQAGIVALTGDRIWAERSVPIVGYLPSQGPSICFRSRGGRGFDYSNGLYYASWWVKCYGDSEGEANQLYRAVVDVLHDPLSKGIAMPGIRMARLEVPGQILEEPILRWTFNLSFFETLMLADYEPA